MVFAEMSEWFKEHDWKSCDGGESSGGSNPLLCAIYGRVLLHPPIYNCSAEKSPLETRLRFAPPRFYYLSKAARGASTEVILFSALCSIFCMIKAGALKLPLLFV